MLSRSGKKAAIVLTMMEETDTGTTETTVATVATGMTEAETVVLPAGTNKIDKTFEI